MKKKNFKNKIIFLYIFFQHNLASKVVNEYKSFDKTELGILEVLVKIFLFQQFRNSLGGKFGKHLEII